MADDCFVDKWRHDGSIRDEHRGQKAYFQSRTTIGLSDKPHAGKLRLPEAGTIMSVDGPWVQVMYRIQ